MRPGLAGTTATLATGARVLVSFIDRGADTAPEPFVGFYEAPGGLGYVASEIVLQGGATGAQPWEHGISAEAVVGLLAQLLRQIGIANAGVLTGAVLTGLAASIFPTTIAAAALAPLDTAAPGATAALATALAAKTADPTHTTPGVGWPHVRGS